MKTIVITGSSRGIGLGLAQSFLDRNCQVVISGSTVESTNLARDRLQAKYPESKIFALACDVRKYAELKQLWEQSKAHFGTIDIWINNAGVSHSRLPVWKQEVTEIDRVIEINLTGAIYGCKVAIAGMLEQGFGAVYNLEGSGSDGGKIANFTLYGTTKYAIRFLTESLVQETKGTKVLVGAISPGMVITDLLLGTTDNNSEPTKRKQVRTVLNILADRVETVSPWLVDRVLANNKNGTRIAWLTKAKAAYRFLTAPFNKRDFFADLKEE